MWTVGLLHTPFHLLFGRNMWTTQGKWTEHLCRSPVATLNHLYRVCVFNIRYQRTPNQVILCIIQPQPKSKTQHANMKRWKVWNNLGTTLYVLSSQIETWSPTFGKHLRQKVPHGSTLIYCTKIFLHLGQIHLNKNPRRWFYIYHVLQISFF